MPGMKEIKNHITSVQETQKITNAMYLIASTKVQKAKAELDKTKPYFDSLRTEIKRVFRTVDNVIDGKYFYPDIDDEPLDGTYGYLIITADKGLAGSYNQTVIREAELMLRAHPDARVFVVGEYGRRYFRRAGIAIDENFLYTAQDPTLSRARDISNYILDLYDKNEIEKIYIIYTDFINGATLESKTTRLLPFHQDYFAPPKGEKRVEQPFEFSPGPNELLEYLVPSYIAGFIYSALVDSFCCEQNARMNAMDSANRNADEILADLGKQYNYTRQKVITQEITEIASGAKYQLLKKEERTNAKG
ncbi:MAG: ATP synthase F1 subunit gamma [Clostridia bacterium]|nr:ATP synthase F1 subunit gamma [Clostridia bacterium]